MENLCRYQEIQGNVGSIARRLRCCNCGRLTPPTDFPVEKYQQENPVSCPSPDQRNAVTLPNILKRILNYSVYLLKGNHAPATDEVILERFAECSACPMFSDLRGQCGVCACFINLMRINEGLNKLADANEECPLPRDQKKWTKVSAER